MRLALPLLIAATAIAAPTTADARANSVRVAQADLDLLLPSDRARLQRRVEAAVRRACAPADARDLLAAYASRACVAQTRASHRHLLQPAGRVAVAAASANR